MPVPIKDRSYNRAKCMVEALAAYNLRHKGLLLEDIGQRYGLTADGARYRIRMIEACIADGTLDEKLRKAKMILWSYHVPERPVDLVDVVSSEKLPVRCISGARFSPLY